MRLVAQTPPSPPVAAYAGDRSPRSMRIGAKASSGSPCTLPETAIRLQGNHQRVRGVVAQPKSEADRKANIPRAVSNRIRADWLGRDR